jgi:site-specific DNA-cytosine methylase
MATRKEIAQNQKILYDDAVANNMFQAAVPTFKEFQKRLEGQGYQKMVFDNYKKHNVKGKGFNNLNEFRGAFGGSFYADEHKIGVSNRTAAILSSANNAVRQAKRNIQTKLGQAKKFNGGRVSPRLKNPLQNQNVQKNEFNYNSTTGKTGTYTTTDGVEFDNEYDAAQYQNQLDKQGQQYINAVNAGEIPSVFDVRDKKGNYDLQENINKNGTYLTEEGAQKQFDKKLEDAYARKKEIEAAIAEDHRLHGNPLLSYGASIGASNGRTAEQSDYSNKLATSLALVKQQIGALEAVKQYPTSSWGEDALKALDNTAFTAKTWDFGLTDFATMGQMERIKTKMDNNIPISGSDKMLLKSKLGADAAAALEDEKMGNIYRWTKIAGQSLPFMADFFLTGGYGGITKGISRGALKFAAKRGMGKVSAAILKNTGIVAGDVIGSYAMAGTEQALKTGADIMQRHLGNLYQDEKGDYKFGTFDENGNLLHEGGESMGTALYKGLTSAMVENYTEKLFGHNYGTKKGAVNFMEKHGMNASAEFFKNIGKSGWYTNSKKWMEKFGINGFGEEVMEEEIGIPLHALLDGDNKFSDLLDTKQQLDIIGGMAISVGSMYAIGAGSRPVKGIYNRAQYYRFRNKVNVADSDAQNLLGDNWADIKGKIDNATNEQMGGVLADILRQRDTMTKEQINAAVNYGVNLMKMRGYNIAKTAEMNAKEITNEPTTPEEQHQTNIDNAYSEGHDADDADKHDIQIQQEDQMKTLAAALGISEQQLSAMSDEELESLTGQDDKLDQAIYDYQLSSARYQGVVDDAQDKVDLAAHQAEQRVDMYTDQSRGSVRNATIKASGGLEDYGVYIISGNVATHEDGSIDVSNSDDMILYYDPTTNSVEHADALMFAELGEELPADDVKAQAVADAKETAIKEVAGIIDGTVEVGSQFNVTGADGMEHTYEVLADYGDGTAAISIDGNVVENPYSFEDLQNLKDLEDQKRLEAAKAQREQLENERAAQQNQETEETQPSFDFNQILNDNGNVVLVDVLDKDGNTKYPDSRLFLIRDAGAKAKVVELKSDGSLVPHAVSKKNVSMITSMSLDEYKQAMAESSMIEDNSGENRGEIEVEAPTIEGETAAPAEESAAPESAETPATEQTPAAPAITLEDGTIVPMLEDGNPDFSKLTAEQTAELYDSQFGEDADSIVSGYVSDAKKALDKASNMTVKGKTFVEQKAAKDEKEKAIADAQAAYDSAIAIRDAYNERQLAKVEDTAEGRKELIEKARRKFARLKSAVKDDAEAVAQIYKETVGTLLHRLYDGTGIDVTDTIPLTAEEYVASNLGAHSLNYEGTETSKGVKQETGLSREDFGKTQLLAADGKGTTIDNLVHSLWENRPSNLDSLDTQDIRNAMLSVITSGFKASEAKNYIENLRIAQAENILEKQKKAADNAAFAEEQKAKQEEEDKKAEENEKINEQNKFPDKLREGSKAIEVPEDATDEKPLGEQRTKSPFLVRENGKQQTETESDADVEKNKVDDMKVVDNIVGEKTRKTLEKIAKIMGANIQWLYSNKQFNGKFDEKTNTIYLTLDSSIIEGVQFIFGHEMTHEMRTKNPASYDELKTLVKDMMGEDAFNSETDKMQIRYKKGGARYWNDRNAIEEEVVADQLGIWIRDANYAHTLLLKMSHPLLARLHEIVNSFLMALHGTEFSDDMRLILRSIEQAYVKTANGQVTNSETGEDVSFSLRQKPEPKKKGIGYKVFVLKDGKLYPPMVANPNGAATPVGVWLDADAAPIAGESKTGRPQVKQGGKGTQGGSGKLAYRPGWHLGVVPYAIQFNRKDAEGNKTLFPKNFVFAEVEYAADVDYQEEARQEGINPSGKYQHSLAGLKHLPTDGYYMYRTNPNPETDPWVITGAMKVNRILTRAEQAELVKNAGREPQQIQEGDIVTDDVVNSINQEIAAAPKFSLKVYHGSGADFTEFDFDHMGEGAGSQTFGWGGYVTSSKKIGKSYANLVDANAPYQDVEYVGNNAHEYTDVVAGLFNGGQRDYDDVKEFLQNGYNSDKENARKKQMLEWFESTKPSDWKSVNDGKRNLYEVDIPDDNGSNYLDFENPMNEEQINTIRDALAKKGVDVSSWEKRGFKLDLPFKDVYAAVLPMMMRCEPKEVSKFLSSLGYTGIKYPAGTIMGGAEEGDTNYVIFKPEDMKITEHTKFSLRLKSAIEETETNPSDAQKESGNYKKGHIKFGGYDYTIENPKGSTRSGKDTDGKEWKVTMHDTYGYIRGKFGKDGDHLDMFINDKADLDNWNGDVFVVDQVNPDGSFDEHKVMYGYDSMDDAKKAYLANYSDGWQGLGNITGASKAEFDKWLDTSNRKLKPFADYAKVKFSQAQSVNNDEPKTFEEFLNHPSLKFSIKNEEQRKAAKDAYEYASKLRPNKYAQYALVDMSNPSNSPEYYEKKVLADRWRRFYNKAVHNELDDVYKDAWGNYKLFDLDRPFTDQVNEVKGDVPSEFNAPDVTANKNADNESGAEYHEYKQGGLSSVTYEDRYKAFKQREANREKTAGLKKERKEVEDSYNSKSKERAEYNKQLMKEYMDKHKMTEEYEIPDDVWEDLRSKSFEKYQDELDSLFNKYKDLDRQIKAVAEPRFSLKDEKTLAGVHNITEEKLRKALKLGGFANPSLAVIDTNKTGHDNFGEISFIAPSALLDKRTGKTAGTWITDAYTQRYPSVEREMSEKGYRKFEDWVDSLDYPSGAKAEIERQAKDALSDNNAPAWELMYLKEKGIDIKEYDSRIDYRWKEIISDHPTAEDILNSMKTDPELKEKVTSLAKHAIIHPTWEKVSLEVRRKIYKETGVKTSPINPQVRKQTKEIFERDYAPTLLNKDGSPRKKDVKKVVEDIVKEHNDTKKYDFYLSKVKASNYVNKNGLYDDYIRWQENKLDEFGTKNRIFRGYTKDGSRKYVPETLENVSKVMREEADGQTNGSEYTSFGSFIAKLASRVDSTDEMRANKDKLSSNKDKEEFYEKWNEVYYELAKFLYNDVFYGEQRLHDIVLQSDPKKYAKKEYGITLTPTFMKKLDALKNAVQTELKSAYFETKYNRPLRLNEFAAVVVPDNLGEDVRKGIEDAGLPMYDYDPNKEGDRSRAFNEALNSSDNIRFSLKEEKEKIVADAKANGTYMTAPNGEKTKLDAEQWATVRTANFKNWFGDWENDPENASKVVDENGEPLVVYHGTTNDETKSVWNEKTKSYDTSHEPFTVFKREVDGLPNSGLFFNSSEDNAYEYGYNNYAVYLSAKNPLVIDCKGSLYNSIKHDGKTMDTYDWANWAEENGYDGVIFKNIKDGVDYGSMQNTTDDYVAFNSNQIKSAEDNNGDFSADNNDIRFSLAGERGAAAADKAEERTFRMDNLSVAKDMEKNKKKAKAIKAATGWERGADGKWRYEMPDVVLRDPKEWVNKKTLTLSDIVEKPNDLFKEYPELFDAYPELKDMKILKGRAKSGGVFYNNAITLNLGYIREAIKSGWDTYYKTSTRLLKATLVHEVQHYIQEQEGFAQGGNSEMIVDKNALDAIAKLRADKDAVAKEFYAMSPEEQQRRKYEINNRYNDLTKQIERLEKSSRIGYDGYKRLSGEVEARNVSARLNMTPEERRKTLAESTEDVARKDQIFLGVGDVSFSLRDMADGKESGAADMAEDLKSLNTPDEVDDAIKTAIEDMPSGWKMANKKMIHIAQALGENRKAEIAGEEPKFSLKDGSLIKAGTYFSGGGLVEEGLKGIIDPVVAVEYDEKISGVYRNNFGQHIVTADVRDVDPKELVKQIDGEVEYFHASPVCKNYSQAKSNHAEVELDKETAASTAEFINAVKPKVVTIENVKGYKDSDAMKTITDALDANGYTWDSDVYNAADYGGYTNRERLIVRAVRDGKLPEKPKKMAHKSGWYEAVADIIPTLTEKKNGVAPWMDVRLKADGIDWRNIDKPLYVMGSAYADGKIPHAFADELLPTLRTKSGDVIVMPDGKVYRAMGRVLARVSGVSDDYKMPFSENLSHTIIGNGIPTQLTEHVIAPLLTGSDPKFSIRTYHGTGASFDKFDFSHMGEGEGSQAFGWGGYVTNSKDIAEDYTRRAKIRKDNGGFEFVTDMSANNKDMVRQYIYKHKDVNKGLDAMRKDLHSAIEMFPDDDDLRELSNILAKKNEEIVVPDNIAYLYDVDIPDDNGDYLDWDAPLTDKQKNTIIKELRRLKIDFADFKKRGFSFDGSFGGNAYDFLMYALRRTKKWKDVDASRAVSKFLSSIGFTGIKYKAGTIFGGAKEDDYNYVIFDENNANIVGNTRFSLRYDQFEHDLNQWKKDNNLPKDAQRPTIPQRNAGESAVDFLRRVDEYRKQMALWKTAPTYEQHLLSDDTALGEFNRELQRGSVLKRIAFQDSMLAIRKAQEAIMNEVGVDRLNMAEDAYTAENRSHGKGKNEFEEYNNEFLQPLRKAYHQMKKILGDSYDNVRIYMMAKHGLERDAQMAFKKSLDADFEDVAQRSAAYRAYKGDMNRITNDSDLEFGRVDFTTWRQRDNALRTKYSPSYMDYRYDENGIAYDYSGLSALFGGSDFEEAAHKLVRDIESSHVAEVQDLWNATNAATKKILRDGYKAGMMSKDTYQYVRDMYSHYIPLRGWDGTTADQVWDYIGGGKGAFNQTLKKANGRISIADDPIAYIENMAESGILLNNKNWVKQHLMLLAQNHPTSLLTLSKAWYVKSVDDNGNEEWIPATPQITSQMNSNQVKAAIDAFEQKMEQMAQNGDATQKRDGLNIAYPQTHSEEREHEVRVMKDGEEYVIYVNGDPQLAQAMNNTRAHRVREGIKNSISKRVIAVVGRKMAAAYTSLSPLFIPSNYFRDLTMTLASTAIREDGRYNYLLRKNLATSWNLGFMLKDYQNGKLRDKVSNGNATPKEQMFYDFMMNGGETGFVSSLDVEDLKKKFKNDLKDLDRWKVNPVKVGHTIMDSIEFLNRMIEDSNRFAVYMTSIQYGRSIDEAVNDAKDVTLNFNRKGTGEYGWQMVRNLYLFINPAVQSLQTLGALAKHHPFKFTAVTASWLASGVLVPVVNAALMSLLGGDDDKDKYWQFTKWDRRNNFIMWVPTTHEFVKIPLAQEFRAFYGVGDMIASKMMGGELAEESWSQYAEDLLGQVVDMLPLDPTGYDGNIAVSLMPNAIRPVFELAFNVDFTGKPLFKETEYNKYDPNFTKAYVGTPDWLVRASRMVNSIGNDYPDVQQNSIDAFGDPRYNLNNPAVVDHVLSSYLGGAYTMGSQVLGLLTKSLNDPKEIKVADIPLFSKFVSNPDDRPVTKKQGDEFWDMKENHDRAANTLSKLKKQAKVDGDYSMLERFYGSEEYQQYKQDDVKVKKYEEDKKKERAEKSGEEYRPHKLNAEDIYKAHATPKDDFEDLKLKQLYTKLNGFKTAYDLLVDTAPSQSDGYYNTNKAAIDAIDEVSLDKQEISELKKGFLDDGKDAYNAEDMKQIRDLRKKILSVLEKANKVVVANQKAKAEK